MHWPKQIIAAAVLLIGCASSELPRSSTVLPGSAAIVYRHLCSRPGIPPYESTWEPDNDVIAKMESRLHWIRRLRSQSGIVGASVRRIGDLDLYYVGIVVKGEHLIYITSDRGGICDGGDSYWGVLYNPKGSGRFFDLNMNGEA